MSTWLWTQFWERHRQPHLLQPLSGGTGAETWPGTAPREGSAALCPIAPGLGTWIPIGMQCVT